MIQIIHKVMQTLELLLGEIEKYIDTFQPTTFENIARLHKEVNYAVLYIRAEMLNCPVVSEDETTCVIALSSAYRNIDALLRSGKLQRRS